MTNQEERWQDQQFVGVVVVVVVATVVAVAASVVTSDLHQELPKCPESDAVAVTMSTGN